MNRRSFSGLYIIAITAFFLGCFLLLVMFGAGVYRNIVSLQDATNEQRALSSYLLTVSKMSQIDITVDEGEYGKMLVMADKDTGYGNRIYVYEGQLVEDYGKIGGKLYPDAGVKIAKTDVFEIKAVRDGLLKIDTSAGSVYIHVQEERP